MNDRDIPGVGKSLHIEEIQSDWGQAIRKQGIKSEENPQGLPNMPMKKTWDELTLKRMIKEAADNGYDAISFTPGEAQAARYDLSKQVKNINVFKESDGTFTLDALTNNNEPVSLGENIKLEKLSDVVGKDLANKISNQKNNQHSYSGLDLKVGGEGMKAFYDKMMVDKVNQLAKKFGGKVETKEINKGQPVHVLKLTPELKKVATEKGFPLFTGGLQFPKPLEQPTFDERWRERVPEGEMPVPAIRDFPTNYKPPERFLEKRPVRLTKMSPDFNPNAL